MYDECGCGISSTTLIDKPSHKKVQAVVPWVKKVRVVAGSCNFLTAANFLQEILGAQNFIFFCA